MNANNILVLTVVVVQVSICYTVTRNPGKVGHIPGDVIIGGLVPIYQPDHDNSNCSNYVTGAYGILRVEAMRYTISKINNDPTFFPIQLGLQVRGTCNLEPIALDQSLNFVLDKVPGVCTSNTSERNNNSGKLLGVVGASLSHVTAAVANLLRLFKIPQISYASTSPDLSDTQKYDYLLRTVPSDVFQARAMVDLIRFLNWTTVYTVNSDTNYGERGMDAFKREAMKYNICILDGRKVDRFTTKKEYQAMLNRFAIEPGVRGVVTFMEMLFYHNLLNAAQTIGKADRFRWIASDAWGFMIPLKDGKKSAENTIVFTLHYPAKKMQDFYSYFWNLTKKSVDSSQNPWFAEFWNFYCDEIKKQNPKSSKCDLSKGTDNTKSCLKDDLHASHAACPMDDKVPYVMDAIYAFAHALKKLTDDRCPQKNSTQKKSCFQMLKVDTKTFFHEYLKKLTFQGITGNISFSEDNEDRGIYDINLFYNGVYEIIGQWDHGSLRNMKLIKEYMKRGSSSCGVKCPNDHIRQVKNNRQCCWTCSKCQQHQYISDIYTCKDCPKGQTPYFNRTDCYNLPVKYWADGWFGTIAFLASAGCCLTLFVTAVFIKFNYTPLIKASSREVSYTLLCGITLNYALTILIATGPTSITCGITKFGAGFTQSVCYAALLVKTSRLARIFSGTPDPIFITPNWQLILVALLILPQICIGIANLLINPPEITYNYDNPTYNLILCKGGTNDLIVAISYNLLLIALCTYYAFRTRKIPANFNEAKYIGFVMYTTCAVWLAFIPVFFSGSAGYTLVALSLNLIVNSTTILFGLFGLKVYIVLLRPEKNSMASSKVRLPSMLESSYSENGHATEKRPDQKLQAHRGKKRYDIQSSLSVTDISNVTFTTIPEDETGSQIMYPNNASLPATPKILSR